MIDVDGYTADEPIAEENWTDEVEWQVNYHWLTVRDRRDEGHNADGFFCHLAGDPECLALGHKPDEEGEWDEDEHLYGWGGDQICPDTRYGAACTVCEGDCQTETTDYLDQEEVWQRLSDAAERRTKKED